MNSESAPNNPVSGTSDPGVSPDFDAICELAASICNTPVAMINILDQKEQYAKSLFGVTEKLRRMPREQSVCQYTVKQRSVFEVQNLAEDSRFDNLPYVKHSPRLRYYLGAPLINSDGEPLGALCVLDYKERKSSEKTKKQLRILADQVIARFVLIRQNTELKKLNKHKIKLMKILSHDIRSPLSGIIGMSTYLCDNVEIENPDARELIQLLAESARQMNEMVTDMLNYTLIETESFTLNRRPSDLQAIVDNMKKLYSPAATLKEIDLVFRKNNIRRNVEIDPDKFEQIFGNLLSNAIKFTGKGGEVHVDIEVSDEEPGQLILKVEDNGIGMDNDVLTRLFDENPQYKQKGTGGEKSTGIGLTIVKYFTELHRGTIRVNSAKAKGTRFEVRIPLEHRRNKG